MRARILHDAPKPLLGARLPGPRQPRCEAVTTDPNVEWRIRHYSTLPGTPQQCSRPSVVELDGHTYCRIHGGFVALEHVLRQSGEVA